MLANKLGYSAKEIEKMDEAAFLKLEQTENKKDAEESDGFEDENLLKSEKGKYYNLSNSSCSFDLADVTGFIFGGFCSRFWMYRKHMNSFDFKVDPPFFAW